MRRQRGYYDTIGAERDVIQNHLLQLLALTAMEEPSSMGAAAVRAEKEKVLDCVRLERAGALDLDATTARGRYGAGFQGGVLVRGYLEEDGVAPDSRTETYAALRLEIANRRWAGVPFYLRAGKRLARRVTEVAVVFKQPPFLLRPQRRQYDRSGCRRDCDRCRRSIALIPESADLCAGF